MISGINSVRPLIIIFGGPLPITVTWTSAMFVVIGESERKQVSILDDDRLLIQPTTVKTQKSEPIVSTNPFRRCHAAGRQRESRVRHLHFLQVYADLHLSSIKSSTGHWSPLIRPLGGDRIMSAYIMCIYIISSGMKSAYWKLGIHGTWEESRSSKDFKKK